MSLLVVLNVGMGQGDDMVRLAPMLQGLLDANPAPTERETRYWMAGNLCRCTGYDKIVRAVMSAADEMQKAPA